MDSGEEAADPGRAPPGRAMLIQDAQGLVSRVVGAIRDAAVATGTNFQYLLATAQVESGLNPQAAAPSSSAGGLFQFVDQTWLSTLKEAGPSLGYGAYADAITQLPSGRYEVLDPAMRQRIMALRNDPTANAAMAGAFTQSNASQLADQLGRSPSDGELYIAHFLGPAGAARLISMAASTPNAAAASAFPGAARANRSIFYDAQGTARTAAQVYGVLVGRYQTAAGRGTQPAIAAASTSRSIAGSGMASRSTNIGVADPGSTDAVSPTVEASVAPVRGYRSLFSDGDRGGVSQLVQDLWSTRPTVAAALSGQAAPSATAGTSTSTAPVGAPLDLFSDRPTDARGLFGGKS